VGLAELALASSSSLVAARSLAFAPRPRALALALAAIRLASLTVRCSSAPVCSVSSSTSALASPERRRIVREIARSLRPIERERSLTAVFGSPTLAASFLPARASARTPCAARPASVRYLTSASITVALILAARGRKRCSRLALAISSLVGSASTSAPRRRHSFARRRLVGHPLGEAKPAEAA